jgi:hypothetical protein
MRALLACCVFCLPIAAAAQGFGSTPNLSGYVTRAASSSDFDVNGWRILCGSETKTSIFQNDRSRPPIDQPGCPREMPRIGLPVAVWGSRDETQQTVAATGLALLPIPLEEISSYGIIEAVLARSPESLTVRADGYTVLIPASAHLDFRAPLHSLADVTTNVWLDYRGEQQADGTVRVLDAGFTPNRPNRKAEKTRTRTDYDPTQVTKKGNTKAELFIGVNAKKIPTWHDPAMQARVTAIGNKLIPAYQRNLPPGDATRIDFRFYVTAGDPHLRGVLPLPSGIILVPHQAVDRMQNDSQLAALLADSIAVEMEAQDARMLQGIRPTRKHATKELAIDAGEVMAIGGTETLAANMLVEHHRFAKEQRQSARVSLSLMHDAGYDVAQAPIAWWRLSEGTEKSLAETSLPRQSVNLYRDLSTMWSTTAASPVRNQDSAAD